MALSQLPLWLNTGCVWAKGGETCTGQAGGLHKIQGPHVCCTDLVLSVTKPMSTHNWIRGANSLLNPCPKMCS